MVVELHEVLLSIEGLLSDDQRLEGLEFDHEIDVDFGLSVERVLTHSGVVELILRAVCEDHDSLVRALPIQSLGAPWVLVVNRALAPLLHES